ncbi:MAG: hypothetical protein LBT97_13515 [Planctomycetota bacterium]|nr:hypothetical protein [Planctomycetota bacterium]
MFNEGTSFFRLAALLSLLACGCGGDGRTAKSWFNIGGGRERGKGDETLARTSRGSGNPDEKAGRRSQLASLRERERSQAEMVGEMREALARGEKVVEREEAKLNEIRMDLAKFDSADDSRTNHPAGFVAADWPADYPGDRERIQPGRDLPKMAAGVGEDRRRRDAGEILLYRGGAGEERGNSQSAVSGGRDSSGRPGDEAGLIGSARPVRRGPAANGLARDNPEAGEYPWKPEEHLYSREDNGFPAWNSAQSGELFPRSFRPEPSSSGSVSDATASHPPVPRPDRFSPDNQPPGLENRFDDNEVFVPDLYLPGRQ